MKDAVKGLHIYANPKIVRFFNKNRSQTKLYTKNISDITSDNIKIAYNKKHASCETLFTSSKPLDQLHLIHCRNAFVTRTYGVHDSEGFPFWSTVLSRGDADNNITYPRGRPTRIAPPDTTHTRLHTALYISYLQFHNFGHFLTETASAIYPIVEWKKRKSTMQNMPIIINEPHSSQKPQIDFFMQLLGIPRNQILIIGADTQSAYVKNLFTAYPTHINRRYASRNHSKIVKDIIRLVEKENSNTGEGSCLKSPYGKIFISRTKLCPSVRHLSEEHELENLLKSEGWHIYHPQLHSITEQKHTYEHAEFICSTEGSALHLLFGCNKKTLKKVVLLSSKDKNNFTIQFKAQGICFANIVCINKTEESTNTTRDVQLKKSFTPYAISCIINNEIMAFCD